MRQRILCKAMNAIKHIRKNVFGLTQSEFAAIAGVGQPTVSRWEKDEAVPSLAEMNRIRQAAKSRKLKARWNDNLFFGPAPKAVA